MEKEYIKIAEGIKIVQISACMNDSQGLTVIGLGSDQEVYSWSYALGYWFINKAKK